MITMGKTLRINLRGKEELNLLNNLANGGTKLENLSPRQQRIVLTSEFDVRPYVDEEQYDKLHSSLEWQTSDSITDRARIMVSQLVSGGPVSELTDGPDFDTGGTQT